MIELFILFIGGIWILGVLIGTGIMLVPFACIDLLLVPLIFIYLLILGSIFYLFEIHFLLGLLALLGYMYLFHVLNLEERLFKNAALKREAPLLFLNQTK